MTSPHCEHGRHGACLVFYGGQECDCTCHAELAPRHGWKDA